MDTTVASSGVAQWSLVWPLLGISLLLWLARAYPSYFRPVWVDTSPQDDVSTLGTELPDIPITAAPRMNAWNVLPEDPVDRVSLKSSVEESFYDEDGNVYVHLE